MEDNMASDQEHSDGNVFASSLSRRQALGLAAGAGAVALGLDLGLNGETAEAAIHGEFHGAWPYLTPPSGHYNTFITRGSAYTLGS
jgi:hypothetical protein